MRSLSRGGVSAVVVTYNSERYISACLSSLLTAVEGLSAEVWVIDNASEDGTWALVEQFAARAPVPIHLLRNSRNLGFTRATNQGLASATGRFLLLLNPDVEVPRGTLRHLIAFLEHEPDVGLVAPQLRFPDGSVQPSCRRFPRR
ncbi:MAG: glycosyltransferase, partial [Calditrichaeota bacterium]|nr:glycosyltransferase [Calditrichota bacterium]